MNPPFRADHVGSLLRPARLKEAAKRRQENDAAHFQYQRVLREEVERVIGLQESVGLKSVTDGELGRSSWFGFFFERLEGFTLAPSLFEFKDGHGHTHAWQTCLTSGKMVRGQAIAVDEFRRAQAAASQTVKANLPSPSALHFFRGNACCDETVYPDLAQWWDDVVQIYQDEIASLAQAGCTYLQLDEVPLAMLCDSEIRDQLRPQGLDPDALARQYFAVINRVLENKPDSMTVVMHLCRGNFRSRWMAQGGYGPIAESLFNDLPVDGYFLEFDTQRAGGFAPLIHVPRDKTVVLGLVSSKTAVLEDKDDLCRRVDDASQCVDLDRLALSPQCGFASVAGGNELTEAEQMQKLELVVQTANEIWGTE